MRNLHLLEFGQKLLLNHCKWKFPKILKWKLGFRRVVRLPVTHLRLFSVTEIDVHAENRIELMSTWCHRLTLAVSFPRVARLARDAVDGFIGEERR